MLPDALCYFCRFSRNSHFTNTVYAPAQIMSVLILISVHFLFDSKKVVLLLVPGISNFLIGIFTDQGVK